MDTFIDSSWYWFRYLSPDEDGRRRSTATMAERWRPVDQYTGGAEHAVMHLLYAASSPRRCATSAWSAEREPFKRLFNQGQILGADGERMSKSRGNVQDPDELVERYGADTVRLFLMFMGPWDQGGPWSPTGIGGVHRFLNRVWTLALDPHGPRAGRPGRGHAARRPGRGRGAAPALRAAAHRTLRDVTEDYEGFRFNTMVAKLMELTNMLFRYRGTVVAGRAGVGRGDRLLLLMLAPAAPHITEELWSRRLAATRRGVVVDPHASPGRRSIVAATAEATREVPVQVNGKLRDKVTVPTDIDAAAHRGGRRSRARRSAAILAGRTPDRVIHAGGGRLVNIVVRD